MHLKRFTNGIKVNEEFTEEKFIYYFSYYLANELIAEKEWSCNQSGEKDEWILGVEGGWCCCLFGGIPGPGIVLHTPKKIGAAGSFLGFFSVALASAIFSK